MTVTRRGRTLLWIIVALIISSVVGLDLLDALTP